MSAPSVESTSARTGREAYVSVEALSWRPHPLPFGTEVSGVLPADVLAACVARGEVSREKPCLNTGNGRPLGNGDTGH